MQPSKPKSVFKRVVIAILLVLAIIVGWFVQSRLLAPLRVVKIFSSEQDYSSGQPETVRVAAWNIAHARGGAYGASNWTGRSKAEIEGYLTRLAAHISAVDADIVVLNEVDFDAAWSRGINQAEAIAKRAGYPYRVEQRNVDAAIPLLSYRVGNAILSRYPVTDTRVVRFPATSRFEAIAGGKHDGVLAGIDSPIGPLRVLAVHLQARSEPHRAQAARIILSIAGDRPAPFIAMGDFNSAPAFAAGHHRPPNGENAMDILLESGQLSAGDPATTWPQFLTFPSENPHKAIDWILVSPHLAMTPAHAVESGLSDHLLVWSDLKPASPTLTRH